MDDEDIFAAMQQFPPVYYMIGDLDYFMQKIYTNLPGIGLLHSHIENIFAKGRLLNVYFFAAANTQQLPVLGTRQAYQSFVRDRKGVLLGGCLNKQTLFAYQNIRNYNEQNKQLRIGQGYAVSAADPMEVDKIVVPQNRGVTIP